MKNKKIKILAMALLLAMGLSACKESVPTITPPKDDKPPQVVGDYRWVVEPKYAYADAPFMNHGDNGLFALGEAAESGALWGYVNTKGETIVPFSFEKAGAFKQGYASVYEDGKWGLIDNQGNIISEFFGEKPQGISEGLVAFCEDGLWGYLTADGELEIAPQFDHAEDFKHGAATVRKGDKEGSIDTVGNYVIEPNWYSVQKLNEKYFIIGDEKAEGIVYGIANENGDIRFAPRYAAISVAGRSYFGFLTTKEKRAAESEGRKARYGLVTAAGVVIEGEKYHGFTAFKEGYCIYYKDDEVGVLNNYGENVYSGYKNVFFCSDSQGEEFLRLTKDGNSANDLYLNSQGKKFSPFTMPSELTGAQLVGAFTKGVGIFKKDEKEGAVSLDGKVVVPAEYDSVAESFDGTSFTLIVGEKWGIADGEGNVLVAPTSYDRISMPTELKDQDYIISMNYNIKSDDQSKLIYGYIRKSGTKALEAVAPRFSSCSNVYIDTDGKFYALAQENGLWGIIELIQRN